MRHQSSGAALLLDGPTEALRDRASAPSRPWPEAVRDDGTFRDGSQSPAGPSSLPAWAPTLVVLANVYLIEGYRWLGVIRLGDTGVGSRLFGALGLVTVAVTAALAALVVRSGKEAGTAAVVQDLAVAVVAAVAVATGTALVVGGPVWRDVAGVTYVLTAATALAAVLLGERTRRRSGDGHNHRVPRIG